ncbi:MAG: hypothetical protein DCC49_12995 [Acidobacteria bacterium]|nr:MAG: hypothetical protein DCC49_12995 [Acidobacteriota bacterium]
MIGISATLMFLAGCATYNARGEQIRQHQDAALAYMEKLGAFPGATQLSPAAKFDCWQGRCTATDGKDEYGAETLFELQVTETADSLRPQIVAWLSRIGVTNVSSGSVPPCVWGGFVGDQAVSVILAASPDEVRTGARYPCSETGRFLYVAIHWTAPPSLTKL